MYPDMGRILMMAIFLSSRFVRSISRLDSFLKAKAAPPAALRGMVRLSMRPGLFFFSYSRTRRTASLPCLLSASFPGPFSEKRNFPPPLVRHSLGWRSAVFCLFPRSLTLRFNFEEPTYSHFFPATSPSQMDLGLSIILPLAVIRCS